MCISICILATSWQYQSTGWYYACYAYGQYSYYEYELVVVFILYQSRASYITSTVFVCNDVRVCVYPYHGKVHAPATTTTSLRARSRNASQLCIKCSLLQKYAYYSRSTRVARTTHIIICTATRLRARSIYGYYELVEYYYTNYQSSTTICIQYTYIHIVLCILVLYLHLQQLVLLGSSTRVVNTIYS